MEAVAAQIPQLLRYTVFALGEATQVYFRHEIRTYHSVPPWRRVARRDSHCRSDLLIQSGSGGTDQPGARIPSGGSFCIIPRRTLDTGQSPQPCLSPGVKTQSGRGKGGWTLILLLCQSDERCRFQISISFGCRNLLQMPGYMQESTSYRKVLDRFGGHLYHCAKHISAPIRNGFQATVTCKINGTTVFPSFSHFTAEIWVRWDYAK
jgi:hypothetical protein